MTKVLAAVVTAVALCACGGPLEEEQAALESQQQALDPATAAINTGGSAQIQQVANVRDRVLSQPVLRNEQRWYGAGTPR